MAMLSRKSPNKQSLQFALNLVLLKNNPILKICSQDMKGTFYSESIVLSELGLCL